MALDIMRMASHVRQGFEDGAERKRKETTRKLLGMSMQGDRDSLKQLYGVDPAAAQQVQQQQRSMHKEVADLMWRGATAIKQAPPEQKAQIYAAVRAEVAKHPESREWTAMLPPQYDAAQVDPAVDQLLAQTGLYQTQPKMDGDPAQLRTLDGLMERAGYKKGSPEYIQAARIFANMDPKARAQIIEGANGGYNAVTFGGGQGPVAAPVMAPAGAPPMAPMGGGMSADAGMGVQPSHQEVDSPDNAGVTWDNAEFEALNAVEKAKFNSYSSRNVPFQVINGRVIAGNSHPQGNQLMAPKKGTAVPSGYREDGSGGLVPIPGGPADKSGGNNIDAKAEMQLRKEYADLVKEPLSIINSYKKVQGSATNPTAAGDLSLIFAYMKMLDPTSVVRETEFANAQNAAGVPDRIQNMYNKILRGERLNPTQRADFLAQARKLADQSQQTVGTYKKRYSELAKEYGFKEGRVTFDPNTIEDAEMTLPPMDGSGSPKRLKFNPKTGKIE